jgi:hypothetical protein
VGEKNARREKMRWLIVCGAMLFATAAPALEDADGSLAKLSPDQRKRLAEILDVELADGPSSRLRSVRLTYGAAVCGKLNTKNRMGAYVGYTDFYVSLAAGNLVVEGKPFLDTMCPAPKP